MGLRSGAALILTCLLITSCSVPFFGKKDVEEPAPQNRAVPTMNMDKQQREALRQRAEQGDADAQYQLGMSYCCGYGPGRTETQARAWLCRAAAQGHVEAQFQLGQVYGLRTTTLLMRTTQYPVYAHYWYSRAAAQGHGLASGYRDALAQDLSPRQLERSDAWLNNLGSVACG